MKSPTCKSLILAVLADGKYLAIHEIAERIRQRGHYHSESAISARQRELAQEGRLVGQRRKDRPYKEWGLPEGQGRLF